MAENVYRKKTKIFSGIVMVVSVALCLFQMYCLLYTSDAADEL